MAAPLTVALVAVVLVTALWMVTPQVKPVATTTFSRARRLRQPQSRQRTQHAFVSLLWGSKSDGLVDFLVLAHSLRKAGASSDIIALQLEGDVSAEVQSILQAHDIRSVVVPRIPLPDSMVSLETSQKWMWVMSKFAAFNLTDYAKVAVLDADMVQREGTNPEDMFEECAGVELCMELDVTPSLFREDYNDSTALVNMSNAGLMVLTPSSKRFSQLKAAIKVDQHKYHLPEQQFISYYVQRPENQMSFRYLSSKWNQCSECAHSGTALIHFMGDQKPHKFQLCIGSQSFECESALPEGHRIWQRRLLEVEPCARLPSQDTCQQSSCAWCEVHSTNATVFGYCTDKRLSCSPTMFHISRVLAPLNTSMAPIFM
jgi:hypothetical protein